MFLPYEQVNSRTVDRSGPERSFEAGQLFHGLAFITCSPAHLFHCSIFCDYPNR